MKRLIPLALLMGALFSAPAPARAADLKIMEPADHSLVRGELKFRIKPELAPGEKVVNAPEVTIQDEEGNGLITLRAEPDRATGICMASLDSTRLKDGFYQVMIRYQSLMVNKLQEVDEVLTLGVRNGSARPAKFEILVEDKPYGPNDMCNVVVKVYGAGGKPMPGARVTFDAPGGTLDSPAAITDSDGEVSIFLDAEKAANLLLTVTVERLAPVRRMVRFTE